MPIGRSLLYLCTGAREYPANAQAGATPPSLAKEVPQPAAGEQQAVCSTLEQAAAENGLPVDFFVRDIGRKVASTLLPVSAKGAQGIAQFMPGTAEWRGLNNPFDVIAALKASASYLGDLRNRFGNLGLAAAAYNAGPQRVQAWLLARSGLPKETRHYVQIITGHSAEEWSGGTAHANLVLPASRCPARTWLSPSIFKQPVRSDFSSEKMPSNQHLSRQSRLGSPTNR